MQKKISDQSQELYGCKDQFLIKKGEYGELSIQIEKSKYGLNWQ